MTTQFTAAATGDLDGLMTLLAPNVTWTADSDGKVSAARRPVSGADKVGRLILGAHARRHGIPGARFDLAGYNAPALVPYLGEKPEGVILIEVEDGKISHFYAMRNPDKLGGALVEREIRRTVWTSWTCESSGWPTWADAPGVLKAVVDAAAMRGSPPPAALLGDWFGAAAVIAPRLSNRSPPPKYSTHQRVPAR